MTLVFATEGHVVAHLENATYVPREGDYIWLNLDGTDEVYKVARIVWDTEFLKVDEVGRRLHKEDDVFVLVEKLEQANAKSAG